MFQDWIELYNPNPVATNIAGWFMTDDPTQPQKWAVPANTVILAKGFLLVWADENFAQNTPDNIDRHANFKLGRAGDTIGLYTPQGQLVSFVEFGSQTQNVSLGLWPDGNINGGYYSMTNFTPRAPNRLSTTPAALKITSIGVAGDRVTLTWSAEPGHHYRVESTSSLSEISWTPLVVNVRADASSVSTIDSVGTSLQRYYRVVRLD